MTTPAGPNGLTDEELDVLLEGFAAGLVPVVQDQLDRVASEFADQVGAATELVAAVYSVSRIRELWNRRIPRIMTSLRSIFRRSSAVAARNLDVPEPTAEELDAALAAYGDAVTPLLRTVGDNLARAAQQTLADGVNAGESVEQLKARLIAAFADTGSQLGPVRADRIAQTEAVRAFNSAQLATAQTAVGPDRPLVKQWVTRHDTKVRTAHKDADGQIRLLDDPFDVGGVDMQYPGDPAAPADLTINCRCILKVASPTGRTASMGDGDEDFQSRMPDQLKRYWLLGEGAAKIRWGTPGSFDRCVRNLRDDFPQDTEGLCANLYHEATGHWPGQKGESATEHTGAMIALVPSEADAARLAAGATEAADQLHLTLFYLGEAEDWSEGDRASLIDSVGRAAAVPSPVRAKAFGAAQWNPQSDNPCWVWNIGDDLGSEDPTVRSGLEAVRTEVAWALEDRHGEAQIPAQHSPWAPHVCAGYGPDMPDGMPEHCGPVVFDRIRVGFGGAYTDFPLADGRPEAGPMEDTAASPTTVAWSTPGDTALAFENQQTGDGRVFAPGALYWDGDGPWPLMANENFDSHDDAALAGAILSYGRDGDRIPGTGVLYLTQDAGVEAAMLLGQGAPLGVSVDLDDVDIEMVDATGGEAAYRAKLLRASVLPVDGGGCQVSGETAPTMTAGASGMVLESQRVVFFVGPDGTVPAAAFELEAAAGDPGDVGTVLDTQRTGDYLMRITRARVRGATLVTVPAFANAKITLDDPALFASADLSAAIQTDTDYDRVLRHVRSSKAPVGPARVAQKLKMPISAAQRLLALAASRGEVVKLTRGLYTDSTTSARADHVMRDDMLASTADLVASVTGRVDLPVADRAAEWDGDAAAARVFEWADGDTDKLGQAFAYLDDDADPAARNSRKLGFADVVDGELTIIPKGVFAAEGAVNGARGGVDIPADEIAGVRARLSEIRAHVDEETGTESMDDMQASAWTALATLPPMPAAWFREPTVEELPPGGQGVNYANGRIYGWVAQKGVPHAGYAKRIVIEDLGRIETTDFLRRRADLDDGSTVKVGAFTMNAGHHRDGAECETAACQFDDTRTVAGIVTVGMNDRGMWFSGAAAPWLSEWDRSVFASCQPSYHLRQEGAGRWSLRAVLSVPVPGHSSPLLATAFVERSNLALTAAATMAEVDAAVAAAKADLDSLPKADTRVPADYGVTSSVSELDYDRLADSLVAAMARAEAQKAAEAAELAELLAAADALSASGYDGDDTTTEGK